MLYQEKLIRNIKLYYALLACLPANQEEEIPNRFCKDLAKITQYLSPSRYEEIEIEVHAPVCTQHPEAYGEEYYDCGFDGNSTTYILKKGYRHNRPLVKIPAMRYYFKVKTLKQEIESLLYGAIVEVGTQRQILRAKLHEIEERLDCLEGCPLPLK